jgi:hypothetical protein
MSVFNIDNKTKHTEALAFLDTGGSVSIQRYETLKYRQFDKLTDKQLGFFWRPEEVDVLRDAKDFKELTPFEQVPTINGVYTWIVYSNDEKSQQFAASRMLSAFEIGTKHNMLAHRMRAKIIHCAGELRIKDGEKEFNFFSGTYMEPYLRTRVKKRACLRGDLEFYMIDKMKSMFFGNDSSFIEQSFIDSSFVPTNTELELYKKHGAVIRLFDDESSCIKSASGGKKRTKKLRRFYRKKRNTIRRKRSKF